MTSLPPNTTANNINTLIKGIENLLSPLIEKAIIVACPTLGAPVIKQITDAIESGLENEATKIGELYADFAVIDVQVETEDAAVSVGLQSVIDAEKTGDPDAIKNAILAYQKSVSAAVTSDGVASTQ